MRLFHKTRSAQTQSKTAATITITPDEPSERLALNDHALDDRSLCHRLNAGTHDEQSQAFGVLYDRYELMIRNYVLKQLNYVENDSLEVIGDTWLVFWRERMNFTWRDDAQTENPLQSWLYGIARNRVKSKVRQNEKERENIASVPLDLVSNFIEARLEDRSSEVGRAELQSEANRQFNHLMKQLTATEQQIVTLRYYKGLTYSDISQQLGKSSAAVRTAHTRLIQKLRKHAECQNVDSQHMEQ